MFWADLVKQVSQALFGDGADFAMAPAPIFRANNLQIAFGLTNLSRFFGGSGSWKEAGRFAAVQGQTSRLDRRPPKRCDRDFVGFVAQCALLGLVSRHDRGPHYEKEAK